MEDVKSVYETIDFLAGKSKLFEKIGDELKAKDTKIKELENAIVELSVAMGGAK